MRQIKFRQPVFNRDGSFNSWHYWGWISEGNFVSPLSMGHNVKGVFGLQFTGLTDKNGKEIWEGDVVKTVLLDDELIGTIEYGEPWGTFYLGITNKHGVRIALHPVFEWLYKEESDDIIAEVIGNIYENPELIKDTP